MKSSAFQIINAAAGSGKTYSLVYAYLQKLLSTNRDDGYKNMLALTFTNKAVNEMKFRILNSLYLLAHKIDDKKIKHICSSLTSDLEIDISTLQIKAERMLNKILHEYAAFEVITLDSFTHKIIKSFAKDLRIPASFEVTLDGDLLLEEMTENLLDQAGIDPSLTKILVAFSLSKTEELKSWNIGQDLFEFSKLLLNENDRLPLSQLKNIDPRVFESQKKDFIVLQSKLVNELQAMGRETLERIRDQGISAEDFSRKTLYTHFEKVANGTIDGLYGNQLEDNLKAGERIYTQSLEDDKKNKIDGLIPQLLEDFLQIKRKVGRLLLLKSIISQWTPLSLIGWMEKGLSELQLPENRLLLSRFNEMIDKEISGLDAPYLYERLGEKYRYYFIDEFQDTSRLQWKNLIPLISNGLQSLDEDHQSGSLLLVGDPKQAIYRWRGGDNEQFLRLLNKESPFQLLPDIKLLSKNHRSRKAIIDFNNQFFAWVASVLDDPEQKAIFEQQTQQQFNDKNGGQVTIQFIEKGNHKESTFPEYQQQTIHALEKARSNGFLWEDMAVLVRKKEHAVFVAAALQSENIPFISSESLSLASSTKVSFLVHLIHLATNPDDQEQRKNIIEFLWIQNQPSADFHSLLSDMVFLPFPLFQKELNQRFKVSFDFELFSKKSIYNAIEYAIHAFGLNQKMEAHLNAFLDDVYEFSTREDGSFLSYLHHWEVKGNHQKIIIPEGTNAVKIMTIHKAKGLEFPVVVFPFASEDLVSSRIRKVWYPIKNHFDTSFEWGRVHFSSKLNYLGDEGSEFYHREVLAAQGDSLNTLYVAMTRAISQMYVICTLEAKKSQVDKSYATLLNHFVWNKNQEPQIESPFLWAGSESIQITRPRSSIKTIEPNFVICPHWQQRLWIQISPKNDEASIAARHEGRLVHALMADVYHSNDVPNVINEALNNGTIAEEEYQHYQQLMKNIVEHPLLSPFFAAESKVLNEKDILIPGQSFVRPDRIVKNEEGWVIIDYKTGKERERDHKQIKQYAELIEEMTQEKSKCYLVYIGHETIVKKVA